MTKFGNRARGMAGATVLAAAALSASGCDVKQELLAPQQPGVISPTDVTNATAANALYTGAIGRWKSAMNGGTGSNTEALWNWEALFTDELRSGDTFVERNNADQRNLATNQGVLTPIYRATAQSRGRMRQAIDALLTYDQSPTGTQRVGELYYAMGYVEMIMSQAFCNGVPFGETVDGVAQYGQPLPNSEGSKLAIAHFDSALTFLSGTDASSVNVKNAVLVAKARAQADLADFAGAAATVASVPTEFQYNFDFSQPTFDNEWWVMGPNVKRYNAGDSIDIAGPILNAIPFARLNDPRVKVTNTGDKAEDNTSAFMRVDNWDRDDPIAVASGIDARLIEAEAKLQANDIDGVMAILNALRSKPQVLGIFKVAAMDPLPTPTTKDAAIDLFFREKALWQFGRGYRMDDLRRLVRQYGRTQDKVFPTGNFTRNGTPSGQFGTQVAFPVPDDEKINPNFHGCLDTNA